jgi:hypothetical protein
MSDELRVPWAVDDAGKTVKVSAAQSGWQDSLFCPACSWHVIAKKGSERKHHFAHPAGAPCSQEKLYHRTAQKLLKERLEEAIRTETEFVVRERCLECGHLLSRIYALNSLWRVEEEWSPAEGVVRADVALLDGEEAKTVFEINATHATSEEARGWYAANNVTVYELSVLMESDLEDIELADPLKVLCLVSAEACAGCGAVGVRRKRKPTISRTGVDSVLPMGKAIWIKEAPCFCCRQPFKVTFGTVDRKLLQPEHLTEEDRELALRAGANLGWVEIQAHKAGRRKGRPFRDPSDTPSLSLASSQSLSSPSQFLGLALSQKARPSGIPWLGLC